MKEKLPRNETEYSREIRRKLLLEREPVEAGPVAVKQPKTLRELLMERRDGIKERIKKEKIKSQPAQKLMAKWQDLSEEICRCPRC